MPGRKAAAEQSVDGDQRTRAPSVNNDVATASVADISTAGLRYVVDTEPGIRRTRRGTHFVYCDAGGTRIRDKSTLERIAKLVIPPAYSEVWICARADGYLQATGRDARGRKQYRYHLRWHATRDRGKFERVIEFGAALPRLRRRIHRDLDSGGLSRDKVLATLLTVMSETLMRVGNDYYTRSNHSYGLTTLRSRHLRTYRDRLEFHYRGKSGQPRDIALDDRRLVRLVKRVAQLPGQRLFQYVDDDGARHAIDSGMVNDYLRDATDVNFSAKDFRTFGATVIAAGVLARTDVPTEGGEAARRRVLAEAVKHVATRLGNTPAVCRNSYIHPDVLAGWQDGSLHKMIPASAAAHPRQIERQTLAFLRSAMRGRKSTGRRRRGAN